LIVEANPDGARGFRAQRLTFGDDEAPRDGIIQDEFFVTKDNAAPATPEITVAVRETAHDKAVARGASTPLKDPEGQGWLEAEWELAGSEGGFGAPLASAWTRYENWFRDVDTNAGLDLETADLPVPAGAQELWARVRHRDMGLAWSPWSTPKPVG